MKRYLVFLFSALFVLAQIAHAEDQNQGKKKKQANVVHQTNQQMAGTKKPANSPHQGVGIPPQNQVKTGIPRNQNTWSGHNNANVSPQNRVNNYNATVAAQNARMKNNATAAAQRWNNQHGNNQNWNKWRATNALSYRAAYNRRHHGHHNRNWWRSHYGTNFVLFGAGYYYWDAGYWYPAYGYDPAYSTYEFDGPIYGYNDLPPGDVVTNVQSALQQLGYYRGEIDGSIGPLTRAALAAYQRDNGLEVTGAIDEPTLASLGLI